LAELPFFLVQLTQLIFEADSAKLGLIGKFAGERRAIFDQLGILISQNILWLLE
jgi:hypothetical protein